jgi:hypothetical protein
MAKLSSKKREKSSFSEEKSLVGLTPVYHGEDCIFKNWGSLIPPFLLSLYPMSRNPLFKKKKNCSMKTFVLKKL